MLLKFFVAFVFCNLLPRGPPARGWGGGRAVFTLILLFVDGALRPSSRFRTGVFALSGIMSAEYVLQNVRFFNLFIVYRIEPISRPAIRLKYRLPA